MSHSYYATCPACGNTKMDVTETNKPFKQISGDCLECGFLVFTGTDRHSLEAVNELREEQELEDLTEEQYEQMNECTREFLPFP